MVLRRNYMSLSSFPTFTHVHVWNERLITVGVHIYKATVNKKFVHSHMSPFLDMRQILDTNLPN